MNLAALRRRDLFALSMMVFGLSARALPEADRPGAWAVDYGGATDPALARRAPGAACTATTGPS